MKVIADLHIHSKYSRATSGQLDIENLERYARIKGLSLLGTGDFTHPRWISELKSSLSEDGTGILKTRTGFNFILQTEISLMYSQGGKGRKIHLLLLAKNFEIADAISGMLGKRGRLDYDGRPIFGINSIEFAEKIKEIDNSIEIIPAHIWTPWFGLFGSMSGFDSVEECFSDQAKHIRMLETGLSSDPQMNWRLSKLDRYSLISNSDCHSFWPWRLGRECNIAEVKKLSYDSIVNALATKEGFIETIEVDPAYGKYHFDGHRNCRVRMSPDESIKNKNICPVCRKEMTIGVLHRVNELSDRDENFVLKTGVPFRRIIPLSEILSASMKSAVSSKAVWKSYYELIKPFGSEMNVLLETPEDEIKKILGDRISALIMKNREGNLEVNAGYDGEYGTLALKDDEISGEKRAKKASEINEKKSGIKTQSALNDFI
ncbi:MAG: endonuclease Q family protein [Candidatus Woesearchaeota archaeon]|nr:endonuclease Q family protein [Candidatus Woesearchaeota archaeon]